MPAWLVSAAQGIAVLAALGTVMAWFAARGWLFDLASHFRWQYAWILGAGAAMLLLAHRWPAAAAAAGLMCVNLGTVLAISEQSAARPPVGQHTVRALLANVLWTNRAYDRVKRLIREVNPEFGVLVEIGTDWMAALRELETLYPFAKVVMHTEHFGLFFFSRVPVERWEVIRLGNAALPSIEAHLRIGDQPLTVIATHPRSPKTPLRARLRNQQLAALAEYVCAHPPGPLMVLGDLNTTPWIPAFQRLIRETRLRDSRSGFGNQPTWPALFIPLMGIPIDHCLVSPEISIVQRTVGPSIGSDHFPIIVEFSIQDAT